MEGPEITFAEATIDNGQFGTRTIRFETGRLAQQAGGAIAAYLDGETMLLSTTTAGKTPKDHFDFFPLTVDVEERMYAAGRIPGSFFRREGRPGTDAILTCRLIDRPLRPTFKKGLRNEVQVVISVLSVHPDHQYDVLAINAASLSTQISGLPFSGPIGAVRVSLIDGQWVAFPNFSDIERSTFDMVVAGRVVEGDDVAIMMVEAESTESTWDLVKNQGKTAPTEEVVAEGLDASKKFIKQLCDTQADLAAKAAKPVEDFPIFLDYQDDAYAAVEAATSADLSTALTIAGKQERESRLDEIKDAMKASLAGTEDAPGEFFGREKELSAAFRSAQKAQVRQRILRDKVRIDGRGLADIRALGAEVEVLPRVHGSALFERGETQILGVTTLNMLKMEQQIDSLSPVTKKRYMHNYNFPPYSTGETGRVGSPKRREIGHGALAERALLPVLPSRDEFPYAIRQVSEALGSNGSTSMGSVCASTMSLLNAGVPLRAAVAGIAMGLVKEGNDFVVLSDILGDEDHLGDMDFKVAGTSEGVSALQMDIKIDGITEQIMKTALAQARQGRLHILGEMAKSLDTPRSEMSEYAPRLLTVKIHPDKIREVIGKGGSTIRSITEETGATIDISDDGTIIVGSVNREAGEAAKKRIEQIVSDVEPGRIYEGKVAKLMDFGAFVTIMPGKDGLVHVSQISDERVEKVSDKLKEGDIVKVKVLEVDKQGRIRLSMKAVTEEERATS
jgi:polyribonucleotide nucleotidyltransferase